MLIFSSYHISDFNSRSILGRLEKKNLLSASKSVKYVLLLCLVRINVHLFKIQICARNYKEKGKNIHTLRPVNVATEGSTQVAPMCASCVLPKKVGKIV